MIIPNCLLIFNFDKKNSEFVIHAGGSLDNKNYLNCVEGLNYYSQNYNLIELDFLFTKDNEIMCLHYFEYLDGFDINNRPTLEEIKNIKLFDKYTIITFDYLINFLKNNPSIKIIFDTKETDVHKLINSMIDFSELVDFDIKDRFILQVYSYENYLELNNLNFKEYWFTNYKAQYSIKKINKYFEDKENITTIVLYHTLWQVYKVFNFKTSKKIAVHTINDKSYINFLSNHGVDYIYVDYI